MVYRKISADMKQQALELKNAGRFGRSHRGAGHRIAGHQPLGGWQLRSGQFGHWKSHPYSAGVYFGSSSKQVPTVLQASHGGAYNMTTKPRTAGSEPQPTVFFCNTSPKVMLCVQSTLLLLL